MAHRIAVELDGPVAYIVPLSYLLVFFRGLFRMQSGFLAEDKSQGILGSGSRAGRVLLGLEVILA